MKFAKFIPFLAAFLAPFAFAQPGPSATVIEYGSNLNPCQSVSIAKSSVAISLTTSLTTQLVAPVAGKSVYLCGIATTGAAASTLTLEYGTGTACGTGTTALTGAFLPSTGSLFKLDGTVGLLKAPAGNALCLVTGGTAGSVQGVATYVQL